MRTLTYHLVPVDVAMFILKYPTVYIDLCKYRFCTIEQKESTIDKKLFCGLIKHGNDLNLKSISIKHAMKLKSILKNAKPISESTVIDSFGKIYWTGLEFILDDYYVVNEANEYIKMSTIKLEDEYEPDKEPYK